MAPVKFYYFDIRGLGESARWILHYGGIQFEDIRPAFDGLPPTIPSEIKSKCRWKQLPMAETEDGKILTQSAAICRYFAKKVGLVPSDEYLAALCDEYVDAVRDMQSGYWGVIIVKDPKEKETKLKEVHTNSKAKYLDVFESLIKANGGNLVGNSLTWADVYLAYALDHLGICLNIDLAEAHPNVKKVKDAVMNSPGIKAWLEKRPKTAF